MLSAIALVILGLTLDAKVQDYHSGRKSAPEWLLIVGIDSRGDSDRGLPDAIMLKELKSNKIIAISRAWEFSHISPSETLVTKYLGILECEPFCNIQGVYAYSAQSSDVKNDAIKGLENLRNLVAQEYKIKALAVIGFDLQWAKSFLENIGEVKVAVSKPIPKGGKLVAGKLTDFSGYIPTGFQALSGEDLFWFARSRFNSSNESRMQRQIQLLKSVAVQKNKFKLMESFLASSGMFITDLELSEMPNVFASFKTSY